MKNTYRIWTSILSAIAMLILILDAQTALRGAKEGITICLYTVIPSLFPFFIFSNLINSAITGLKITLLSPLVKLCGIPVGSESLLLLGLIGGYPVGAQAIYQAYKNKTITRCDALRMLGFCSNAGPAFIFGMMSGMFNKKSVVILLWMVHIASAIIVGAILPHKSSNICTISKREPISFVSATESSVKIMAGVCGWVIIFRVFISFMSRWILWIVPESLRTLIVGLVELSNGCVSLYHIDSSGLRYILASFILSFGGVCVYMQTKSVTKELGTGVYFQGKTLQGIISMALSTMIQQWIFPSNEVLKIPVVYYIALLIIFVFLYVIIYCKNNSRNLISNSV